MKQIIKIEDLSKSFGDIIAIDSVSLNVEEGQMFALVGPDGAGKSTMIKILCGLLSPAKGNVNIFGLDITKEKKKIQANIGYLSQKFTLYGDLTVDENIEFFAEIHGVHNYIERRNELLKFTRLIDFNDRLAENLSGGMKQKLALACSLIHKPKIIFLDEPTTGVDAVSRRDFWKILANLLKDGITIFMSTPYLDEAERCNVVALMDKGKILSLDTPENIKHSTNKTVIEIVTENIKATSKILKENLELEIQLFGDRLNIVTDDYEKELKNVEKILIENSINIKARRNIPLSLENVFIHKIREKK